MKYFLTAVLFFLCFSSRSLAQESVASVFGHVHLESPDDAQNMLFGMEEITSGAMVEVSPADTNGAFEFPLLPFATYDLYVREQDHSIFIRRIVLSSPVPIHIELDSIPSLDTTDTSPKWLRSQSGAHTLFTAPLIAQLPVANTIDGIDALERNMPGIVPAENSWMHLRGEDPPPEFVIDGIPITTEETRTTMPLLDASFIESADLLRGGLDPRYGSNRILNIDTKSGFNATTFGHAEYSIGTLGNSSQGVDLGGRGGNLFSYYGSYGSFSTNRYLDPISGPNPNHTNGSGSDYFGKLDILPSSDLTISLLGYYDATSFQIPNLSTVTLQDQDNSIIATMFSTRIDYNLSPTSILSAMGYTRRQSSSYTSNGISAITDSVSRATALLNEQYFIGARSENFESGGELAYSATTDWFGAKNDFNITAQDEIYPLQQYFTFAAVNGSDDTTHTIAHPFLVDTSANGKRISAYAEDRITTADWTISGGLRYDLYDLLAAESGLSPRINLAYRACDQLTLRASYNRIFEQAPLENYLISSSSEATFISRTPQNIVLPEQSNNFELGANYQFSSYVSLDASGYYKSLTNMLASFELGNSGIFFPANIKKGTIYGGELELLLKNWNHLSGILAVSSCRSLGAIPADGSSPYSAGLVIGGLAQSYAVAAQGQSHFYTADAEPLAASFLIRYDPGVYFFAVGGRLDGGLPLGYVPPIDEGSIPYQGLLDRGSSGSIAPHATFDFSAGYNLSHFGLPILISASVINIFNTEYLTAYEPVEGGAHYGMPRTFLIEGELSP